MGISGSDYYCLRWNMQRNVIDGFQAVEGNFNG